MDVIQEYKDAKERVEEAKTRKERAEGGLAQVMTQLDEEFGCSTLEEAEKKSKLLQRQEDTTSEEFEGALDEFNKKWPE